MPAPPPESDPATIRTRPRISTISPGDALDGGGDLVDDAAHHRVVLALGHHADHRLGARVADDQPAACAEPALGVRDNRLDGFVLERRLAVATEAHVLEDL